jgi:hypothetical protein
VSNTTVNSCGSGAPTEIFPKYDVLYAKVVPFFAMGTYCFLKGTVKRLLEEPFATPLATLAREGTTAWTAIQEEAMMMHCRTAMTDDGT